MALIVQNNDGSVPGANAYISVEEFKAYHDDRAQPYAAYSDAEIETAIIRATDYLDQRFRYVGKRRQGRSQTTEWPRLDAWDGDGHYVNGIPAEVKEATAEYALRALSTVLNPDPEQSATGFAIQSKSESVGPISESVTYVTGAVFAMPRYPAADQRLLRSGLVRTGGAVLRG